MDPITQTALGIVVSESTFRRRIGKSANWLAAVAAASPDLDVATRWLGADPWTSLAMHRSFTHSLVMVPAIALLWTVVFWAFRRKQFRAMYALACLAVLSHPLLDLCTSYGTQLFWPFTDARYAFDFLPIVDIFYTPILLITIVACFVARKLNQRSLYASESRRGRLAMRIALVGFLLSTLYGAAGAWVDHRTQELARDTVPADHGPVVRVRSGPMLGTIFARRLSVRTTEGYYVARHNVITSPSQPQWHWAASADGPFVERADAMWQIQRFRWFTMRMARPVVDRATGEGGRNLIRVTYYDMRYGYPADSTRSIFHTSVVFDGVGNVLVEPTAPHGGRRQGGPEGVLGHFPADDDPFRADGNRWKRIRTMWSETWRP